MTERAIIITEDGVEVFVGSVVFDYYSQKWGVIETAPDNDLWFDVRHEDGTHTLLNGERIATYDPKGSKPKFGTCYLCGEPADPESGECAEMFDPNRVELTSEIVHGECGVANGWEVA